MKPAPFVYFAPETIDEVVQALGEHGSDARVLAGGQSLVPMMNMRLARPSALVDVTGVSELCGVRTNGELAIGASTRQAQVLADSAIGARFPLIHEALRHVGHPANRARGTFGGSIANADPAAELPAIALALNAEMVIQRSGGQRVVAADDFFVTYYTTALDTGDVLTEVRFPGRTPSAWGFREVARRHGDFALAGVAFAAETDASGSIGSARVALFGVTDRPVRAIEAENALVGRQLGDETAAREAAALAPEGVDFASDVHVSDTYRREATVALVRRAVLDAARAEV